MDSPGLHLDSSFIQLSLWSSLFLSSLSSFCGPSMLYIIQVIKHIGYDNYCYYSYLGDGRHQKLPSVDTHTEFSGNQGEASEKQARSRVKSSLPVSSYKTRFFGHIF